MTRLDPDEILQSEGPGAIRALNDAAEPFIPDTQPPTESGIISGEPPPRRTIRIKAGKLRLNVDAAENVLVESEAQIYVRDQSLMRPVRATTAASNGRVTDSVALVDVHPIWLRDQLSAVADWERFDKRCNDWMPCNPPTEISETLVKRSGEWRFKPVSGVINAPTLRPDGSILSQPGYDPVTRLILLDAVKLPPISKRPTMDEARKAIEILDELIDGFPFVDQESRSVALSALITPVVRGAMATAPMHAATAPTAGTGKSYLFDVAAGIAIGDACPVLSAACDAQELEKRIGAKLMAGHPLLCLDNVNGELGGDFLCQIIDRPIVEPRVLGLSRMIKVPNQHCVFANGNNLRAKGDLTRRIITTALDAKMDRPSERAFAFQPYEKVLQNRGRYVAAALTIVRAYIEASRPDVGTTPFASFEDWSKSVRSALIWLGYEDPVKTADTAHQNDPERVTLEMFIAAMSEEIGVGSVHALPAGEIIKKSEAMRVEYDETGHPTKTNELECPQLKQALSMIPCRQISSVVLGRWMNSVRGRPIDGIAMQKIDVRAGQAWYASRL